MRKKTALQLAYALPMFFGLVGCACDKRQVTQIGPDTYMMGPRSGKIIAPRPPERTWSGSYQSSDGTTLHVQ
jgi:hypothetical protein